MMSNWNKQSARTLRICQCLPLWETLYWGRQKSRSIAKHTEWTLGYEHITDVHLLHKAFISWRAEPRVWVVQRGPEGWWSERESPPPFLPTTSRQKGRSLAPFYSGKCITWLSTQRKVVMFPSLNGIWGAPHTNGMFCPFPFILNTRSALIGL